jgi:GT2 family glycosyltransferase
LNPLISIITVTHNSQNFLPAYFDSIIQTDLFKNGEVEILMYDSQSKDGSVQVVGSYKKKHPQIKLVEGENIGFAKANNILAQKARGVYLFILNPDTKIENNALKILVENKNKGDSILIPKQFSFENKYLSNGLGIDVFGFPYDTGKVFYADGAAIFIKKDLFFKLGMFDCDYFMFYEDVDLSWKSHLMGVLLLQTPEAIIYHYSGGSIDGGAIKEKTYKTNTHRRYLNEKNLLQNILKNYSLSNLIWILPINCFIVLAEIFLFLVLAKPKVSFCYIKAYWWNLKNIKNTLKKRKWIQAQRIIPDNIIMKKMYWGSAKLKFLFKLGIPRFER